MGRPAAGAFTHATVHVMDTPGHVEEALLWDRGHIVAVGRDAEVRRRARESGIEPVDLGGRVVIPGFVDAHTHFLHVGLKKTRPDLRGARSLSEALERTRAWLATHPGRDPVVADGWDESEWKEPVRPTRRDADALLDAVGQKGRPLVFRRIDGHTAVAGSAALVPLQARWPTGGLVDSASGALLEDASLYLNEVFPASDAQLDAALEEACSEAHRLGVTAVGDYQQAPYRAAVLRAARRGSLTVRVFSSIYPQQLEAEVAAGFRTGRPLPGPDGPSLWCRDGGLKVFLDGSLGAHTAHLREPYLDGPPPGAPCTHPHPKGTPIWSDDEVDHLFGTAHAAGIQVHAHAIGDGAIDQGLDTFARLAAREDLEGRGWHESEPGPLSGGDLATSFGSPQAAPRGVQGVKPPGSGPPEKRPSEASAVSPQRHRFEHFEIVHDDQVARTAELGIVASSQPNFVGTWSSGGGMYEERLGSRFRLNNRFRTFKEAGIRVAFGSDGMPFGPLVGIQAAVGHPEVAERLTAEEAVWHYTQEAAWAIHWEDSIGTLEPGRHADLVVLGVPSLDACAPQDWAVVQTFTAGAPRL